MLGLKSRGKIAILLIQVDISGIARRIMAKNKNYNAYKARPAGAGEMARKRLAQETGTVRKDWGGRIPVALVFPNTYYVGMSSLGFQTIYRLFNDEADVVCERAFLPD